MNKLHEALERDVRKLQFHSGMRQRVLDRVDRARRKGFRPQLDRRGMVLAAAVCGVLVVTALAAGPTLWTAVQERLGSFAPYAQPLTGAVQDQGVEIEAVGALSDGTVSRIYLSVRDVTGDRLDQWLRVKIRVVKGTDDPKAAKGGGWANTVRYDPEAKTALVEIRGGALDGGQQMRLQCSALTTRERYVNIHLSPEGITGETLDSAGAETDRLLVRPSDVGGQSDGYLPRALVMLRPGQTPRSLAETEEITVTSMGFASDGLLHVRLKFAPGVTFNQGMLAMVTLGEERNQCYAVIDTKDGIDVIFLQVTPDDLDRLNMITFYGWYDRPGLELEGEWTIPLDLENVPRRTLAWTGTIGGSRVDRVELSALSITAWGADSGNFANVSVTAQLRDGTTATASPAGGRYHGEGEWSYSIWTFDDPVEPEDVVSLTLLGETFPAA